MIGRDFLFGSLAWHGVIAYVKLPNAHYLSSALPYQSRLPCHLSYFISQQYFYQRHCLKEGGMLGEGEADIDQLVIIYY